MDNYWGEAIQRDKFPSEATGSQFRYCGDAGLNFSTIQYNEEDGEFPAQGEAPRRPKVSRDPQSHRIIEKRRRDRMNSCLADLARLIPQQYLRKGRGRVEKTEIIEMAIRHLKHLHQESANRDMSWSDQYRMGYHECLAEATKYLLGTESDTSVVSEPISMLLLHLRDHCDELLKGDYLRKCRSTDNASGSSDSPTNLRRSENNESHEHSNSSSIAVGVQPMQTSPTHHAILKPRSTLQLRDMVTSCSDMSNDDVVKDTNTVPVIKTTTSGHPFKEIEEMSKQDCPEAAKSHLNPDDFEFRFRDNVDSFSPPRIKTYETVLRTVWKTKESHNDTENNNNQNSYKFKNFIKNRFTKTQNDYSENSGKNVEHEIVQPTKLVKGKVSLEDEVSNDVPENMYENTLGHNNKLRKYPKNFNVPIFVLHANGTYYVPLSIEFDALQPFLTTPDMLDCAPGLQTFSHPVTISVAFNQACDKDTSFRPKLEGHNGW